MPNHWHMVLQPNENEQLSQFFRWVTATHTMRYHAHYHSSGEGHVYQGRFKSFPVQDDDHFHVVCRYVERNALRAGLVKRAEQWRWGSLYRRIKKPELDRGSSPRGPWHACRAGSIASMKRSPTKKLKPFGGRSCAVVHWANHNGSRQRQIVPVFHQPSAQEVDRG